MIKIYKFFFLLSYLLNSFCFCAKTVYVDEEFLIFVGQQDNILFTKDKPTNADFIVRRYDDNDAIFHWNNILDIFPWKDNNLLLIRNTYTGPSLSLHKLKMHDDRGFYLQSIEAEISFCLTQNFYYFIINGVAYFAKKDGFFIYEFKDTNVNCDLDELLTKGMLETNMINFFCMP